MRFFPTLFSHFFHRNVKTMWNTCEKKMCFKNTVLLLEKVWKNKHFENAFGKNMKKMNMWNNMWTNVEKEHLNIQLGRCNSEISSSGLIF